MMPKKSFDLKNNDLMVVPILIRKKINALKWEYELVREFYASLTTQDELVAKVWFYFVQYSFMPISHSSTILMEQMLFLYANLTENSINVGKIILKEIHNCAKKKAGSE
ncbi:hypothetical protein Gotur_002856 [Gossypium turneri]